MSPPAPRALLVDFYGTLAHAPAFSVPGGIGLLLASLSEDGLDLDAERFTSAYKEAVRPYLAIMRGGTETHNTAWVADALRSLGIDVSASDARVVRAVRRYFEGYAAAIEPLPGADVALQALGRQFTLVLVSNFTDAMPVRAALERFGWNGHFKAALVSADLGIRKPHRGIFEQALLAAGCAPHEALHVGDDIEEDIAGARAAGIPTCHVTASRLSALRALLPPPDEAPAEPDYRIAAFAELPALLGVASA